MQQSLTAAASARIHAWHVAGAVAGPLFIGVYTIEDLTRPGFSALRDQVSQLALGDTGWVQGADFFVTGLLVLAGAAGLRHSLRPDRVIPALVALTGVAFVAAAFFATNPGPGYPPGTDTSAKLTAHTQIHDLAAGLFFVASPQLRSCTAGAARGAGGRPASGKWADCSSACR